MLGQASGFNVEYNFGPSVLGTKLGAFLDAREQGYTIKLLDGTRSDQVDFNIAVGFTVALLD